MSLPWEAKRVDAPNGPAVAADPDSAGGGHGHSHGGSAYKATEETTGPQKRSSRKPKKKTNKRGYGGVIFLILFGVAVCLGVAQQSSNINPTTFKMPIMHPLPEKIHSLKLRERLGEEHLNGPAFLAFGQAPVHTETAETTDEDVVVIETPVNEKRDVVYTTINNGSVILIDLATKQVENVISTGHPHRLRKEYSCGTYYTEAVCGRPTGISFDQDGLRMYVVDSYHGLYHFNPEAKKLELLVEEIEKREGFKTLSELVISPNTGYVYFLESSTQHKRRDETRVFWETSSTGRLLQYDPETQTIEVLTKKLVAPTGLTIIQKKAKGGILYDDHILVTEPPRARIKQVYLKTKDRKDNRVATFAQNLPMYPYSIKQDPTTGDLWVGGQMRSQYFDQLSKWPNARKLLSHVPFFYFDTVAPRASALIHLNSKGKTKDIYRDDDGELTGATNFQFHKDTLYVSSERSYTYGIAVVDLVKN